MLVLYNTVCKNHQLVQQNYRCKKLGVFSLNKNNGPFQICHFSLKTIFVPKKRTKLRKRLKRVGRKWLRIKRKQLRSKWRVLYKKRVKLVSKLAKRYKRSNKKNKSVFKISLPKRKVFGKSEKDFKHLDNKASLLVKHRVKLRFAVTRFNARVALYTRKSNIKIRRLFKERKLRGKSIRRNWRKLYSRPWRYRFPRWRTARRYYSNRKSTTGRWGLRDLLAYRAYTLPHQPYRNRKPWHYKNNRWSSQYRYVNKIGTSLRRKQRLLKRQIIYKLYKRYYNIPNRNYLINKNRTFRKISSYRVPQKLLVLNLFEKRLDISLCRMNLAPSLKIAQVLIQSGFVYVNNKQITSINHFVDKWDLVCITPDSYVYYLRYWYVRTKYKVYLFKNKALRSSFVSQEKLTNAFGFKTRFLNEYDLSRQDRIKSKEVERLFLWK